MSGLEVIGGISAVITIIDTSIEIYNDVKDRKKLPEDLKAIGCHLPIILSILEQCKNSLGPHEHSLSGSVRKSLAGSLAASKEKVAIINQGLASFLPVKEDDQLALFGKLLRRLRKGHGLKEIMAALAQEIYLVVNHQAVNSATSEQNSKLETILREMGSSRARLAAQSSASTISSDIGLQTCYTNSTVNTGSGHQINGNVDYGGGGQHFSGNPTFSNAVSFGAHHEITARTISNISNISTIGDSKTINIFHNVLGVDYSFRKTFDIQLGQISNISSELFVGRDSELEQITKALHSNHTAQRKQCVVLSGMGGVGKTQLAIKYANSRRGGYSSVFWLNAASEEDLNKSFRSIAGIIFESDGLEALTDEAIVRRVYQWLSDPANTRWLLIFDNYDDPESFRIEKHYPSASFGAFLVTSRRAISGLGVNIDMKPFGNDEDSLAILGARSERENAQSDYHAKSLAERLDGLPLALATAGAYLQKNKISFKKYLEEYEKHWVAGLYGHPELREYGNRTLYTTWELPYTLLKKSEPNAAKMLKLLAYFDNQHLSHETFCVDVDSCPEWLPIWINDRVKFRGLMGVLTEYNFLGVHPTTESWSMHNCVHDWTLAALNQNIDAGYYWYSLDCVDATLDTNDPDSWGHLIFSHSARHAPRLLHQRFLDILGHPADTKLNTMVTVASFLSEQAQLHAAEQIYLRALDGYEESLGPDQTRTLDVVNNLGCLYRDQGRLGEAEQMFIRLHSAGR